MIFSAQSMNLSDKIISWYKVHKRDLPWRQTKDPYRVWLSEIILQQTRVAQGMDYYLKFERTFPSVFDLADASEDFILKNWQGLGYYSRARNMHATAKKIVAEFDGIFPDTYDELVQFKGVGDYTACAIASFCFNRKCAVVDGNVYRVLSRIFGIETPIDSSTAKTEFKKLAESLICAKDPGSFNQAIMEFGALQCVPKSPDCNICLFEDRCIAKATGRVSTLPAKSKKIKSRTRYFEYLILLNGGFTLIHQRNKKDIWEKLYEFPLLEYSELQSPDIVVNDIAKHLGQNITVVDVYGPIKHLLSHQKLYVRFWQLEASIVPLNKDHHKVAIKDLDQFAFPKVVDNYLREVDLRT
jgi:A/G-specific adenine glycosylase